MSFLSTYSGATLSQCGWLYVIWKRWPAWSRSWEFIRGHEGWTESREEMRLSQAKRKPLLDLKVSNSSQFAAEKG
jgi:hypothetical protein